MNSRNPAGLPGQSHGQADSGDPARREYTVAIDEIGRRGWRFTTRSSLGRLDGALAAAVAAAEVKPACRAGCWYCCHFKVEVRAEEAFAIVDHVREHFTQEQSRRLRQEVADNAKVMRRATPAEQLEANLKCPFLAEGVCSIYEVRPARCRTFHATDVEICRESYEQPHNLAIHNTLIADVSAAGEAHIEAISTALRESGYDRTLYEFNTALDACLTDTGPARRYERGKPAFGKGSTPR